MIKTFEKKDVVTLRCTKCGEIMCVETDVPKFAYIEINRFRKRHEHLKERS